MPYLNGQYYSTNKERQAILDSSNPTKSSGSSSSSSSAKSSSTSSSSSASSSSSSRTSSGTSSSSYVPGGVVGLIAGAATAAAAAAAAKTASSPSSSRTSSGASSGLVSSTPTTSSYSSSADRNYHQEAVDAAARGDWSAVSRALAARQDKINAQGGNDRGTSNAQILQSLQQQYGSSYNALPSTLQNTLNMAASGQLNSRGWESGIDYLAQAQNYARAGDLDAAYDALLRRGFKMADTGSAGGGTSQDQAYALIQKLFDQGAGGEAEYLRQLADNARLLAEHPTQFGTGTNPSLANKHFVSADNQYIIYYDSNGTPFKAQPNNGQYGSAKYTPEYAALMERYYGGSDDYADLRRQMHNLDVAYSGNGRLIDQNWNWASGTALPLRDSYQYWTDFDNGVDRYRNTGQDKDALNAILARINSGESFSSPTEVPIVRSSAYDDLSGSGSSRAYRSGGTGLTSASGLGGYDGEDLTQYIRAMYQQSLEAQLASLQSGYQQNLASINAQDALISQAYQSQRNQAAGQSDLQRMYMAELGNYQGLNTGATGQLALAQSMALQNSLASLGTAENQDLAANGLVKNQLGIGYQSDVNSAIAQSNSQMSGALYNELVRQVEAAEAARAAAQAQANWEAQFNYQKQQDALAYQSQQQSAATEYQYQLAQLEAAANKQSASNAWDYAQLLLKNGVMPDEGTLLAAGLDARSAQALADSYQWQLAQKYAPKSSGSNSGGGNTSLKAGMGGGDYDTLFQAALASGRPESFIANNYKKYGFSSSSNLVDDYYNWDSSVRGGNGSFGYFPDEGLLTWNGTNYNSVGSLARAIEAAGLNSAEKNELSKKMKMYGIDVEF